VYAGLPLLFCGSGGAAIRLAREGGLPADLIFADVPNPCGSDGAAIRLARDDGLSVTQSLTDVPDPIVGAGLLANTVYHSTSLLADTPFSRASPLPHYLSSVERKICVQPRPLWERACSR